MGDTADDLSGWDLEDARGGGCEYDDDARLWVTKDGKVIEYYDLETTHIKNIIRLFEFDEDDVPHLFQELARRE